MVAVTQAFKSWLKSGTNMKLSSDAAVLRLTHEGITNYDSLLDFDTKSIERLPATCKEKINAIIDDADAGITAEPEIAGANLSSISVRRLIVAVKASEYYSAIGRTMNADNMHYNKVLKLFKVEWDTYRNLRDQDEPETPLINDKDGDRKVIKWVPTFLDSLTRTYGINGPLVYVLREDSEVPPEADDPLEFESYFGASGSLHEELIKRLVHTGPIYKNDNTSVFMKIEKATRGTSVESTVKAFSRRKDGRAAFLALIANHAGDTKYRSILKKRMNLLQSIKWNGRSYPLETHVSNHRQAVDDLRECSDHITVSVPDQSQRVEYLIDSIACNDNTLQAAIGLIRANTNNMRNDFESAASALIEVDPYRRSQRSNNNNPKTANVSSIDFSAGRGTSGVDLRWHPRNEFQRLPSEQKDELLEWMKSNDGKKAMKKSRDAFIKKRKASGDDKSKPAPKANEGNWKKRFKKAIKTPKGLQQVMSVLAEEEKTNTAFVAALHSAFQPNLPPAPAQVPVAQPPATAASLQTAMPATSLKLQSILKNA